MTFLPGFRRARWRTIHAHGICANNAHALHTNQDSGSETLTRTLLYTDARDHAHREGDTLKYPPLGLAAFAHQEKEGKSDE